MRESETEREIESESETESETERDGERFEDAAVAMAKDSQIRSNRID